MKIRGERLTELAAARGVSPVQLAQAVERVGLKGEHAATAVRNWMRGNDHPRCKAADCQKMAALLGVEVKDIVKFTCQMKNHRGSPRKAKLVIDLIRGKKYETALNMVTFTTKRAAVNIKKALLSAYKAAEDAGADADRLYVVESTCDDGVRMKRFQPKDRGRAHSIIKRSANLVISLAEKASTKK